MNETQEHLHNQPLLRHHTGMTNVFLKLMKVAPFDGGPINKPAGAVRLLGGYSSSYLMPINEGKQFILIDAGVDIEAGQILGELHRQDVSASAVKAIFLTHGHLDHVGGINQFPEADIYVGGEDAALVKGEAPSEDLVGKLFGKQTKTALRNTDKLHSIKDGDVITVGNRTIHAFAVPGHTKGSTAYLLGDVLFIGDAMTFDRKGRLQKPPKPVTNDMKTALQSLRQLVDRFNEENIHPSTVLPSHSGPGNFETIREYVTNTK